MHDLAVAWEPLRRRTAITAQPWFVRYGDAADLRTVFALAPVLAEDPDPVVPNAVGIALKHAGSRDPDAVVAFLDRHGASSADPHPSPRRNDPTTSRSTLASRAAS